MPPKKKAAEAPGRVAVVMAKDKETKRTVRFIEPTEGDDAKTLVGTIYVPKDTLAGLGNPDSIVVSVEAAPAK